MFLNVLFNTSLQIKNCLTNPIGANMKSVFNTKPVAFVALFAQATACKGLSLALCLHYGCISCTNFFLNATCAKLMQAFCTLQALYLLACAINATCARQFLKNKKLSKWQNTGLY